MEITWNLRHKTIAVVDSASHQCVKRVGGVKTILVCGSTIYTLSKVTWRLSHCVSQNTLHPWNLWPLSCLPPSVRSSGSKREREGRLFSARPNGVSCRLGFYHHKVCGHQGHVFFHALFYSSTMNHTVHQAIVYTSQGIMVVRWEGACKIIFRIV